MELKRHLTIALSVLLLVSCQGKDSQTESPQPIRVKTMEAATGFSQWRSYSGTVEEENGTPLSFSTAGTVKAVFVHLGQRVQSGQLIAVLDSTSMQSAHRAASASLKQAEDAYRRMKELHDKGSLPEIKWVEVQSQVEQARSMEQIAAKNLKDCRVYAPYSGVISEKNVEVGQNVMPGAPVARLVTASALNIKIAVPEAEIASVSIGQKASFSVPALGDRTFTACVTEKGIVANPLSRSYDVKLKVEGNGSGELLPGMVANLSLQPGEHAAKAVTIPAQIVQLDEKNNTFVWVVENGKAHKRIIACGEYTADGVSVLSGLSPKDKVITEGQQKVCEGTEVAL